MLAKLTTAVSLAIADMPIVLSGLIGEYAAPRQYGFNTEGLRSATVDCAVETPKRSELKIAQNNSRWQTFVSDVALADGPSSWSVEWTEPIAVSDWMKRGLVGVGLTTSVKNKYNGAWHLFDKMADENDWMINMFSTYDGVAGQFVDLPKLIVRSAKRLSETSLDAMVTKIWFTADASTGTILCRWSRGNLASTDHTDFVDPPAVIIKSAFGLLRPCVVVGATATVVVTSEPTDCPADRQQELRLVAAL